MRNPFESGILGEDMKSYYIHNARIHTLDASRPIASAILIRDGIIEALEPPFTSPGDAELVDLEGRHLFPGLIDTHTHSFEGGLYAMGCDASKAESIEELLEMIRHTQPVGGMIVVSGFEESSIRENRFPTLDELDSVCPEVPLLFRRIDGHSCAVNQAAARLIGLDVDHTYPLRGRYNDIAAHWFHRNLSQEGILTAYHRAAQIAVQAGITTIHTMVGDAGYDPLHLPLLLDHLDDFPVKFIPYPQVFDVEIAQRMELPRIGGCILADGSFGSHTAALRQPYHDSPEEYGQLYRGLDDWISFFSRAHQAGLQTCVHAIGDGAVEQLVTAWETVLSAPSELKHQIIHCELTDEAILNRMSTLGLSAVVQPVFDRLWAGPEGLYEKVLGKHRTQHTNHLRAMTDSGLHLTGSSDWYITPLDAISGLDAACSPHHAHKRLTGTEALHLYTVNAAQLSGDGDRIGRLLPGMQADFIAVDRDLEMDPERSQTKVLQTWSKGRRVYP